MRQIQEIKTSNKVNPKQINFNETNKHEKMKEKRRKW